MLKGKYSRGKFAKGKYAEGQICEGQVCKRASMRGQICEGQVWKGKNAVTDYCLVDLTYFLSRYLVNVLKLFLQNAFYV